MDSKPTTFVEPVELGILSLAAKTFVWPVEVGIQCVSANTSTMFYKKLRAECLGLFGDCPHFLFLTTHFTDSIPITSAGFWDLSMNPLGNSMFIGPNWGRLVLT